jgi:arsenate reductase (thioredoxin)
MSDSKKTILFLCTGNAARSQMAEALARLDYGDLVEPVSAGSRPAGFVHELAEHAMADLGVDLRKAYSKSADEFHDAKLDLLVTVCDSAAADCPIWPGARHVVHWSVEDPSFVPGDEEKRLAAFRKTRDELRRRIDGLMEALRHSVPKRSDRELLEGGAQILDGLFRAYGLKFEGVQEEKSGHRHVVRGRFARRGRAVELQVRSGGVIAEYQAGGRAMRHPDYIDALGASGAMRYPGASKDPLDAFRRLRADLVRHAGPFLSGRGLKEFGRLAHPAEKEKKKGPLKTA